MVTSWYLQNISERLLLFKVGRLGFGYLTCEYLLDITLMDILLMDFLIIVISIKLHYNGLILENLITR